MGLGEAWSATKQTFKEFFEDEPFLLAAALAFYAMLSLAPLLLIVVAVAGLVWGEQAVQGQLAQRLEQAVGPQAAGAVETVLANASAGGGSIVALTIGIVTTVLGATTIFAQLQIALNHIWDVKANPKSAVLGYLWTRLLALGTVLLIALLLLASLVASAMLSTLQDNFPDVLPFAGWIWQIIDIVVWVGLLTLFLALLYKYLPDVSIEWQDVWVGAFITSLLFVVGKFGIGLYLGYASVGSAYGAAGSLVVLLLWIYYSALILLLGAEITQVYAHRTGRGIEPSKHAISRDGAGEQRRAA